ncbi:unnamed protein product [Prunus armeniaca]|uniref:Protein DETOXIFICATION n=1 Tax=Prunus armeniaca TaxID=36596 RepID=A0A6J5UU53_PRUAR|nr:unnamed protein product [Prunus armeniaca]
MEKKEQKKEEVMEESVLGPGGGRKTVMFAGHLGELQLAGATLANSWANVTGFALVVGLSGALETLCGQGFGAKSYRMLGIYLQASCIISFLLCSIISIIWFYTEPLLILLRQDPQISKTAALFLKHLIPGLFAYGFLQNILRFLQTQSVYVMPMVFSVIAIIFHIGITYGLVHWTALGFLGAPLAASISLWLSVLMLAFNVSCTKTFERTWEGFSFECFDYILTGLKLALPSATMECLEEWGFEILVLLGGLMPNSAKTSSLLAMCVNTQEIGYKITYGLIAAASTRVSNELGAGNPDRAQNSMVVTLSSPCVARGCGWQHLAAYVNLATCYLIGMTISGLLGFKLKLYAKGLWIGIICGLSCQASAFLLITLLKKWTQSD